MKLNEVLIVVSICNVLLGHFGSNSFYSSPGKQTKIWLHFGLNPRYTEVKRSFAKNFSGIRIWPFVCFRRKNYRRYLQFLAVISTMQLLMILYHFK